MTEVRNSIMNRETTRRPLEVLNVSSERNSETETPQPSAEYLWSDKSRIQLLTVCSTRKPYKCKFCSKLFSCSLRLEVHTKWHVKNPFQCRFCEHNFETAQGLTKHIKTHTDVELLVCDHCNKPKKCFSFSYARKKLGRYVCDSCGRCFTLQSVFVTHLRSHIRQKTFVCKSCNVTFAYSAQFRWHRANCKQNQKPSKRDLIKKPCFSRSYSRVEVGIDLDFRTDEDNKVNISNLLCTDQIPRYNNDTKTSIQFWNNHEEEGRGGNTQVTFANRRLFDTEKNITEDKSIISSILNQECLSGENNLKNPIGQIQNTTSYDILPKMNESCSSNLNFPPRDLFQSDINLPKSTIHYPETSSQEDSDLTGEMFESSTKSQDLLKCNHCSRAFFFQESLDKHLKRYNKTKKHTCEYCGQTFTMASILNAHIRKHTGEMPFKCDPCGISFTYSTQLHRHRKVCNTSLQQQQAGEMAATDAISVKGESPLTAIKRSKSSSSIGDGRTGYPACNNSYNLGISSTCGSLGDVKLNTLARRFYAPNSVPAMSRQIALGILSPDLRLSTHLTNVKENENYDFNIKSKTTAKTMLPQEESSLHCLKNIGKILHTPPNPFENPSNFPPALSAETPDVHPPIPLSLPTYDALNVATVPAIPSKDLARYKSRKNNPSKNNGNNSEKRFQCRSCGKSFALAHNLKQHVRTHTGERPFKCDYCQARFSKSSILTVHLRRHTGEKPYGCKNCQRMFTHLTQLHRHLKVCRATDPDATYPADLSPSDMTRVISLGPNSFKKLTVPKTMTSFVNPTQTNPNGKGSGDKSKRKDEKNDKESNSAAKLTASSTLSVVDVLDFQPQLLESNCNSNYSVVLNNQGGNLYMKPEVNTFSS